MPPPDVFVQLLDDSAGIPLIYGIMLPSGFIFLQEFSDALESIIWNPILPAGTGCDRNGLSTDETQNGEDAESISICSASSNSRKLVDCTIDIRTTVESELTCERVISADATIVALGNGAGDADDSQG